MGQGMVNNTSPCELSLPSTSASPCGVSHYIPQTPFRDSGACFGALILELDWQMTVQFIRRMDLPKVTG